MGGDARAARDSLAIKKRREDDVSEALSRESTIVIFKMPKTQEVSHVCRAAVSPVSCMGLSHGLSVCGASRRARSACLSLSYGGENRGYIRGPGTTGDI